MFVYRDAPQRRSVASVLKLRRAFTSIIGESPHVILGRNTLRIIPVALDAAWCQRKSRASLKSHHSGDTTSGACRLSCETLARASIAP